jgi:hypothetical protein
VSPELAGGFERERAPIMRIRTGPVTDDGRATEEHPTNVVRRRVRRLALGILGCLGVWAMVAPAPAGAQLNEGMSTLVAPFTIEAGGRVVGQVVVVGGANTDPPPGYTAGVEYWTWTAGRGWRDGFTLVPRRTVPRYNAFEWQTFPHERFDLSRTVPLPAVSPAADDGFYRVQIAADGGWLDQGFMWLDTGSPPVQNWYGVELTKDLIGDGGPIRFLTVDPPAAGSVDVYLLHRPEEMGS